MLLDDKVERLSADLEIALYRLVQDGLENTVRHARAQTFELRLQRAADGLVMEIADDGVGIADLDKARHHSHGLAGMMHRAHAVGGSFDLKSEPGKGTRIRVFVPLKPKA